MILIDTNVVSELMRPAPEPAVVQWMNNQPSSPCMSPRSR